MGRPFELEPWQQAIVGNLFGWQRPDGRRRYEEVFIYVARKNGKSELAAGLGLMLELVDQEPSAQVYCAAGDREQARHVFNAAKAMVYQEPELNSRLRVLQNAIWMQSTNSTFKVVSSDARLKHGINAHGVIIDELHVMPNRDLVDALATSTGARRQPVTVYITTADYDRESICNEKYEYASRVRDGVVDDRHFLPAIYEVPLDVDWRSERVWRMANPNLGVSKKWDYIRRQFRLAKEMASFENTFRRLDLNQRTQQDIRWLRLEQWDACKGGATLSELEGRPCWAGLDLSTTTDISAFVMVFPCDDGAVTLLPRFWIPEENANEREKRDKVPYVAWAKHGFVRLTPQSVIDYDQIRREINEDYKRFDIREIAIDRWNATQLATQLQGDGFEIIAFGQGYKDMNAPTKELEKLVVAGLLGHQGNPVLRWMASHVAVEMDAAGNLKPSKKKSTERIDGIVAAVMGLGRILVLPEGQGRSPYEDEDFTFA